MSLYDERRGPDIEIKQNTARSHSHRKGVHAARMFQYKGAEAPAQGYTGALANIYPILDYKIIIWK